MGEDNGLVAEVGEEGVEDEDELDAGEGLD